MPCRACLDDLGVTEQAFPSMSSQGSVRPLGQGDGSTEELLQHLLQVDALGRHEDCGDGRTGGIGRNVSIGPGHGLCVDLVEPVANQGFGVRAAGCADADKRRAPVLMLSCRVVPSDLVVEFAPEEMSL